MYLIVFSPVIEVYGTKKSDISDNTSEQDQLIVAFGVFMGFAEYEKNIEYHQTYPLLSNDKLSVRSNIYTLTKV